MQTQDYSVKNNRRKTKIKHKTLYLDDLVDQDYSQVFGEWTFLKGESGWIS